jgi:4-alpha-glucanotransferase
MSDNGHPQRLLPFSPDDRAFGVLLYVTSLPSPLDIGDVGPTALAGVDRLHDAGQTWWQALPLGSTVYGNSPYPSRASFAGNALLVSPDLLIARMNVPVSASDNRRWRSTKEMLSRSAFRWLWDLTLSTNRLSSLPSQCRIEEHHEDDARIAQPGPEPLAG